MAKAIPRWKNAVLYDIGFPRWLERQAIAPEVLPDTCPFTSGEFLDRDGLRTNVYDLDHDQV